MHKEGLPKQSLFVSATNETMKSLVGHPMTLTQRICYTFKQRWRERHKN